MAPSGIANQKCELCAEDRGNKFAICDEVRCTSLGSQCEFRGENPDGSEAEVGICVKKERDTRLPVISAWDAGVAGRKMQPIGQFGYNIEGVFDGREPIVIGVKTDEVAGCAISKKGDVSIEEMEWISNEWGKEHKIELTFASEPPDENSLDMYGGGEKVYYVSCKDAFENVKPGYKIQFKVKEQPRMVPPTILKFEPKSDSYVPYETDKTNVYLLVDAPVMRDVTDITDDAGCRYTIDSNKIKYEDFEGKMSCFNKLERDSDGVSGWRCMASLTGLKDNQENVFYFRCKDKDGNVNDQSQPLGGYKLIGTRQLSLDEAGIEGYEDESGLIDVYQEDVVLYAETSDGAEDGIAECRYEISSQGAESGMFYERMFKFSETGTESHKHSLKLVDGSYYVNVVCRDKAGNEGKKSLSFKLDTEAAPNLIRVYTEGENLHLILDHETETCKYDIKDAGFNFEKSTLEMVGSGTHFRLHIGDDGKFYIRCKDKLTGNLSPVYTVHV